MERIQPQLAASTFLVLPSSCPTGSSRTAHPGASHFHITVRLIRATNTGEGEEGEFRNPGDEVWQVSDTRQPFQKRDVTLPEIVHSGQRRASLLEIVREL